MTKIFQTLLFLSMCMAYAQDKDLTLNISMYPAHLQNNIVYVNENFPLGMQATFTGKNIKGKKVELMLSLPEKVKCIAAFCEFPRRAPEQPFVIDKYETEKINIGNDNYIKYKLNISKEVVNRIGEKPFWRNEEIIFIKADISTKGLKADAYWELQVNGQRVNQGKFGIEVIDPVRMPAKPCKKFKILIGNITTFLCPDKSVRTAYLKYWQAMSKKPVVYNYYLSRLSPEDIDYVNNNFSVYKIMSCTMGTPFFVLNYPPAKKLNKANKLPLCMRASGKEYIARPVPGRVGMRYLIEDPENLIWEKTFANFAQRLKNDKIKTIGVVFDIEPGGENHDYSLANRKLFAKQLNLKQVPESKTIKEKYRGQWFDFMVKQNNELIKRFYHAMRKYLPEKQFVVCTDPLHAKGTRIAKWCAVDSRLADDYCDMFMNMYHYSHSRFFDDMEFNAKVLKKNDLPMINPSQNLREYYKRYNPASVKQNIVATAVWGRLGIGFWPNDLLDGRYLKAIADAMGIVSQIEDYLALPVAKGISITKSNFSKLQMQKQIRTRFLGNRTSQMVSIFNYDKSKEFEATLSVKDTVAAKYLIRTIKNDPEQAAKQIVSSEALRKGIQVKVPVGGIECFIITPQK